MLITLTLNPALDVSGIVDKMIPNEKVYVRNEKHSPGGNGINAAIIAHRLGAKVLASGLLGGSNGAEIKELLSLQKIPQEFISIEGATRMNLTVNNCHDHQQTRLSFPGPQIKAQEKQLVLKFLGRFGEGDTVVIGGSLPPGLNNSFAKKLILELHKRKVKVMVDMPGTILKDVIKANPLFIKPNLVEFQDLIGKRVTSLKSILQEVRLLNKLVPLICVSSVDGGAILVSEQEAFFGKIPKVKVQSTVGAGDSMVGAILAQLEQDPASSLEELLRWGLAASAATLVEKGMTLGSKKSIQAFHSQIKTKEI